MGKRNVLYAFAVDIVNYQGFEKALQVKDKIVIADFYAEYVPSRLRRNPHTYVDRINFPVGAAPARFWDQS